MCAPQFCAPERGHSKHSDESRTFHQRKFMHGLWCICFWPLQKRTLRGVHHKLLSKQVDSERRPGPEQHRIRVSRRNFIARLENPTPKMLALSQRTISYLTHHLICRIWETSAQRHGGAEAYGLCTPVICTTFFIHSSFLNSGDFF